MAKTSREKSGKAGQSRPRRVDNDSGTAQPSGGLASGLTRLIASPLLLTFAAASVASAAAALLLSRRSRAEENATSEPPATIPPKARTSKSRRKAPRPQDATSGLPSPIELEMARSKARRDTSARPRRVPKAAPPEAPLGQPEPSAFAFEASAGEEAEAPVAPVTQPTPG